MDLADYFEKGSKSRLSNALFAKIISEVRRLVVSECANHQGKGPFGIKNFCWMKEESNAGVCIYFTHEDQFCKYFEEAVLPLDDELKEEYFRLKEGKNERREIAGNRPTIQREGSGRSAGSIQVFNAETKKAGMPMDKPVRQGILPRSVIHGMASKK